MSRYIIANWKMNMSKAEAERFASLFGKQYKKKRTGDHVVICPSFLSIATVAHELRNKSVAVGAQDVSWEEKGNFTGEVSPKQLKKVGVRYCIVGHSERRQYLSETDALVRQKVAVLLKNSITPILCIGETKQERAKQKTTQKLRIQIMKGLEGLRGKRVIIAYEPIWAISKKGKGVAMQRKDIENAMDTIQGILKTSGTGRRFSSISLVYGGSVTPKNIEDILSLPAVNGVLIGSASLSVGSLLRMTT